MAWDDIQQGADLKTAWTSFQNLYQVWLPQHRSSLQQLANRTIKG